jgi:hypothetical protein
MTAMLGDDASWSPAMAAASSAADQVRAVAAKPRK